MDMEHAFFINAGAGARNWEQVEAQLEETITPFLNLLFNRTSRKIPPVPEQFRRELAELDGDIARGELRKHFDIDTARRQITPRTNGANLLLVFIRTVTETTKEGGEGCRQ